VLGRDGGEVATAIPVRVMSRVVIATYGGVEVEAGAGFRGTRLLT